mmetsp:Transcript_22707/g.77248  ORF Transcript_22707/g.77248 Transcript_22707/m.77248 type:complete len:222 (-) Transcript_22707:846-1511(-)
MNSSGDLQPRSSVKVRIDFATRSPSPDVMALKNSTRFVRFSLLSWVAMPQSSSTSVGVVRVLLCSQLQKPSSRCSSKRTCMLPGCRSACRKLSESSIFSRMRHPRLASALFSASVLSSSEPASPLMYCVMLLPSSNVSTRTSSCTNGSIGKGNATPSKPLKFRLNRRRCSASRDKSSCSHSGCSNCRTLSSRRIHCSPGSTFDSPASARRMAKSRAIVTST